MKVINSGETINRQYFRDMRFTLDFVTVLPESGRTCSGVEKEEGAAGKISG
jgi:hypothetical protein